MPTSLVRDLQRLSTDTFDLLVIGGGIYGLTVACDAAQRGLHVALVEAGDFGSGTSFNHLRTIHGGLRYLQTLDLARARESLNERRTLARIAPWAVRPLPFVLPLGRSLSRGPAAMRIAFMLDSLVASDRNEGLPEQLHLPTGRVIGRDEAVALCPLAADQAIAGAAVWHDYVAVDADRLTLAWGLQAAAHGAALANYVEATALVVTRGHVAGAECIDRTSGHAFRVQARTVVNATGARLDVLLAPHAAAVHLPFLQAMNVVTRREAPATAVGGRSASGRNLFLVPWRGRALFGTWESSELCDARRTTVDAAGLDAFLAELNDAFPSLHLTRNDVALVHRGVVPARVRSGQPPTLEGHDCIYEHSGDGLGGMISVAGTKYTTARGVAERIVSRLFTMLSREAPASVSAHRALPHAALDGDALLRHAAQHEMVVTLSDAVVRRTTLGALGCPDDATLAHAAMIVGAVLGWTPSRQTEEVAAVRALY
ncbi:MAG: FAD-dependent oxidoreductase [Vicinamibacterales bacterium]